MSSIRSISAEKRTRPIGAPDEPVRPRCAYAAAAMVLSLGPAFAQDTNRKMHAVLPGRGWRRGIRRRARRIVSWEVVMRAIAILSVLVVSFNTGTAARAQQTNDCKLCREYQQACVKNHTRDACNNEHSICMKYCRKK